MEISMFYIATDGATDDATDLATNGATNGATCGEDSLLQFLSSFTCKIFMHNVRINHGIL